MKKSYSRVIRYAHWFNVPLLSIMMWSGVLIYWAHQAYYKLPSYLVEIFKISYRLAEGMSWHFFTMWFYSINGIIYLTYFFYTKRWRMIFPNKQSMRELIPFLIHNSSYEGIYNPAQRIAYTGAIFLNILAVISGLAIYKPVQLGILCTLLGGYESARLVHFLCLNGLGIFILIHIIQVIRAGWKNFRLMITGEEIEIKK